MWVKILELLLGKILDRLPRERTPRERLVRALVDLFGAMTTCHQAYMAFRHVEERHLSTWQRSLPNDEFDARIEFWRYARVDSEEWQRAIVGVARDLDHLRLVLDIHDPELLSVLNSYINGRSLAFEAARAKSHPVAYIAGAIGRGLPGSDMSEPEYYASLQAGDCKDFEAAITKLRGFMLEDLHLSAEEIMSGRKQHRSDARRLPNR